jgi:hypothetical protein
MYLIYCKNFCKCHKVPQPSTTIKKEDMQMGDMYRKNCSISLITKEKPLKNIMMYLTQRDVENSKIVRGYVEKNEHWSTVSGDVIIKNIVGVHQKIKSKLPSAYHILCSYSHSIEREGKAQLLCLLCIVIGRHGVGDKTKNKTTASCSNLISQYLSKEIKIVSKTSSCTPMLIAVLFAITKL